MSADDPINSGPDTPEPVPVPGFDPYEPLVTFWQTYNQNKAIPIAILSSVFAHLTVVAGLVGTLFVMNSHPTDTTPVPIALVENGQDETGQGNPNNGGEPHPLAAGDSAPTKADRDVLPNISQLPEVMERIQKEIALDPTLADATVSEEKIAPIAGLAEELQNKLALGKPRGAGNTGAAGPGGSGSDSTRARSLRWVMRFSLSSEHQGREYLNQLSSLGAVVMIPIPPANKSAYLYKYLTETRPGQVASDQDWADLASKQQFCEYRREMVQDVVRELKAPVEAYAFWVFFPKSVEEKLDRLEREYQGRKPEDIAETVFQFSLRGGQPNIVVVRQVIKN